MFHVDVFPHEVHRLRSVIFPFQDVKKGGRKSLVKKHMPQHIPGIGSADGDIGDPAAAVGGQTVFLCGSVGIQRGIVWTLCGVGEEIFRKIIVRTADVSVGQNIPGGPDG